MRTASQCGGGLLLTIEKGAKLLQPGSRYPLIPLRDARLEEQGVRRSSKIFELATYVVVKEGHGNDVVHY